MSQKTLFKLSYLLIPTLICCVEKDIPTVFDCNQSDLQVTVASQNDPTTCQTADGQITVLTAGGLPPYTLALNGNVVNGSAISSLFSGEYIIEVRDANGCKASIQTSLQSPSSLKATTSTNPNTECTDFDGEIFVDAVGGAEPYTFQLESGSFATGKHFAGLPDGVYNVTVKDAEGCLVTVPATIARVSTGVSFKQQIKPILEKNCNHNGCHSSGTGSRDWTVFNNISSNLQNIKSRVVGRSMPPDETMAQSEIDLLKCWIDDGGSNN